MPLSALPGEVLVKIVEDILFNPPLKHPSQEPSRPSSPSRSPLSPASHTSPEGHSTSASRPASPSSCEPRGPSPPINLAKEAQVLRSLDRRLGRAVELNLAKRFHAFEPAFDPIVQGHCNHWLPRFESTVEDEQMYWRFHIRTMQPTTNQLRLQAVLFDKVDANRASSVKIDARICDYDEPSTLDLHDMSAFAEWCAAFALISRLGRPNPTLKTLHVRLSIHTEIMPFLDAIFRQSHALTDVVIEADYPGSYDPVRLYTLSLAESYRIDKAYSTYDRFVLRAPGLTIKPTFDPSFFERFKTCTTFCVAIKSVDTTECPALAIWVNKFLSTMTAAERVELSVADDRTIHYDLPKEATCMMPRLMHLTLDFREVGANLLDLVHAPLLAYIRIRSVVPIGNRGSCEAGRFPSLVSATVWCPGSVHGRFRALGIAKRQYVDDMQSHLRILQELDGEAQVYVRKFVAYLGDEQKEWYKRRRLC